MPDSFAPGSLRGRKRGVSALDLERSESGKSASSSQQRTQRARRERWRQGRRADAESECKESAPGWVADRIPMYLGVSSVPLPGERAVGEPIVAPDRLQDTGDDRSDAIRASLEAVAGAGKARSPDVLAPIGAGPLPNYPSFDFIQWSEQEAGPSTEADACALRRAEVHLRKLDTDGFIHRRLVAGIEVEAPLEKVWSAITDYEGLTNVLPALVVSELVPPDRGQRPYPPGMVRVRQLAVKKLAYVEVHTEVVLDVLEKGGRELQFRQYEGDFDLLQGKWILEASPFNDLRESPVTVVRYSVEMAIETASSTALGLVEPLVERISVEDIPANLVALKAHVEGTSATTARRRKLETFEDLKAELTKLYGDKQEIPSRQELRDSGRVDIEVAIAAQGGTRAVAELLKWGTKATSRRPKGYWNDASIRAEIDELNEENQLPPRTFPSKALLFKYGRKDLYAAITKAGGFNKLSELYQYALPSRALEVPPQAPATAPVAEEEGSDARSEDTDAADDCAFIASDNYGLRSVQDLLQEAQELADGRLTSTSRPANERVRPRKMALSTREVDILFGEQPQTRHASSKQAQRPGQSTASGRDANRMGGASVVGTPDRAGARAPQGGVGGAPGGNGVLKRGRPGSGMLSKKELNTLLSDNDDFSDDIRPRR